MRDAVDEVELSFKLSLDSLPSDIALGRGAREVMGRDHNDKLRRGDPLVEVPPGVERARLANDFLLQLGVVDLARRLDEEDWRRPATADDDAVCDEGATGLPDVVFNRPGKVWLASGKAGVEKAFSLCIAAQAVLRLYPVVVAPARQVVPGSHLLEEVAGVEVAI